MSFKYNSINSFNSNLILYSKLSPDIYNFIKDLKEQYKEDLNIYNTLNKLELILTYNNFKDSFKNYTNRK